MVGPEVKALAKWSVLFFAALTFYQSGVKNLLRCSDQLALASGPPCSEFHLSRVAIVSECKNARNQLNKSFLVTNDHLHKAKVTSVSSTLNSHPLMVINCSLAYFRAYLDELWHLWVGDHLNNFPSDALNAFNKSLDMSHVVSLDIETADCFITVED